MRFFRFVDRTGNSYTVLLNGRPIGEVVKIKPGVWNAVAKRTLPGEFATRFAAAEALAGKVDD